LSISSAQGDKEPAAVVKAEIDALLQCNILQRELAAQLRSLASDV